LPDDAPVLLTTADHALLSPDIVSHFLSASSRTGGDAVIALVQQKLVDAAFPGVRRTVLRFSDGGYCSCNLFAFLTPRGRTLAGFWQRVEQERKRPWRVLAGVIGLWRTAAFVMGYLTLGQAAAAASERLALKLAIIDMPFADAGVDVDTPDDYRLVEQMLARRG